VEYESSLSMVVSAEITVEVALSPSSKSEEIVVVTLGVCEPSPTPLSAVVNKPEFNVVSVEKLVV